MATLVGVHDPAGGAAERSALLAEAAGVGADRVVRLGDVVVACEAEPVRVGPVSCLLQGQLHDVEDVVRQLRLAPGTPPAAAVAHGYRDGGVAFLRSLRGAYHLVLWDEREAEAFIAPDHLCSRAVFHHSDGRRTTFGSDVAPLLDALPSRPGPDHDVVPRWFTDRALPDGLTVYQGVHRLRTGWSLQLGRRTSGRRRVWAPEYRTPDRVTGEEAGAQIRAAVQRSVRRRITLDGTTGILLSGGFDSGTLASTAMPMLREVGHQLPSYSTVFPGAPWDESPWVDVLTDELRLPSTRFHTRGGALHTAVAFQRRWALPQPAPGSILDQPLLDQARQDGLRVMLDGQGGDELFAHSPYLLTDYVVRGRWLAAVKLARRFPGAADGLAAWQIRALLKQVVFLGALPHAVHRRVASGASEYDDQTWLTPHSRARASALEDPWRWKQGARGRPRWWSLQAFYLVGARELAGMQDYLRRRGDLSGIDSRQPLMGDVDLIELMLRLPPELAFHPDYDRGLARDAMRGIVPEPVRVPIRKSNYGPLMYRVLAEEELPSLQAILGRDDVEVGAYVDRDAMRRDLLGRVPASDAPGWAEWSQRVWGLVTTELWLRSLALGKGFEDWVERLRLEPPRSEIVVRRTKV